MLELSTYSKFILTQCGDLDYGTASASVVRRNTFFNVYILVLIVCASSLDENHGDFPLPGFPPVSCTIVITPS